MAGVDSEESVVLLMDVFLASQLRCATQAALSCAKGSLKKGKRVLRRGMAFQAAFGRRDDVQTDAAYRQPERVNMLAAPHWFQAAFGK